MIKRTISTVLLWLAVGGLLYFLRAPAGALLVIFLAATSQHELYGMLEKAGYRPFRKLGVAVGIIYLATAYLIPGFDGGVALGLVVIAAAAILLKTPDRISAILSTAGGFVLIPFLLHFFIRILHLSTDQTTGLILAVWVVVLVKFADIGAYLTGSFIGRTKLAPSLSPGKTWEGACGGLIISALLSAGYVAFFQDAEHFPVSLTPLTAALVALPIAAVSVVSDLVESAFKRSANVKDSGKTIPGIGGSYDLTDSLTLSAPVAYVLLQFLTQAGT